MSSTDNIPKVWKGLLILVPIFAITGFVTPTFWLGFDSLFWWGLNTSSFYEFDVLTSSMVCFMLLLALHSILLVFALLEKKKPLTQGKPLMIIGLVIFIVVWTYYGLMYGAFEAEYEYLDFSETYNWGWGFSGLLIDAVIIMVGGYISHYQQGLHS